MMTLKINFFRILSLFIFTILIAGAQHRVPGKIEAEDFNEGENRVAYFDTTEGNLGNSDYRSDTDVDLRVFNNKNTVVSYFAPREWIAYTLSAVPGEYDIEFSISNSSLQLAQIEVFLDNRSLKTIDINHTGGLIYFKIFRISGVKISASGMKQLKVLSKKHPGLCLDYINFIKTETSNTTDKTIHPIPGVIQAEHYKDGKNGSAYFDHTKGNSGYYELRDPTDVDLQSLNNKGARISHVMPGEWWTYSVSVTPGRYNVSLRSSGGVSNKGSFELYLGAKLIGTVPVTKTKGWNTFKNFVLKDVILESEGMQTFKVLAASGENHNFDLIEFKKIN